MIKEGRTQCSDNGSLNKAEHFSCSYFLFLYVSSPVRNIFILRLIYKTHYHKLLIVLYG